MTNLSTLAMRIAYFFAGAAPSLNKVVSEVPLGSIVMRTPSENRCQRLAGY